MQQIRTRALELDEDLDYENPERHLIAAVVARALFDLQERDFVVRALARNWIFDNEVYPWTFHWCMQHLELEPCILTVRLKSKELLAKVEKRDRGESLKRGRKCKYFGQAASTQSIFELA